MSEENMSVDQVQALKLKVLRTEIENIMLRQNVLAAELERKQVEENKLRSDLFALLPGDKNIWNIDLGTGVATKIKQESAEAK